MMADYCDVVGMTGAHEIAACNEVGLPYAMLAMVDNYANGVGSDTLSLESFHAAQARNLSRLETCVGALLAELPARAGGLFSTAAAPESSSESMSSGSASATHAAAGPKPVDLIVHARWVVPVASGREEDVYDRHAVVVEHGRIVDILPSADVGPLYAATRVVTLGEKHVLMPGLVNAHTHLAMMLLKGVADDLPLFQWLSEQIWPTEGRLVSSAFVAAGARAAFAELIRGGVTCVNDMYFFPCQTAAVAEEVGMRALVASPVLEFPSNYASDAEGYLAKGEALHQTLNSRGDRARVRAAFGPHAPYTVSDATLEKISAMSLKTGARVHMHLHETAGEVLASETGGAQGPPSSKHLSSQSCTPVANLARLGLLNERLIAVHMTTLSDADIAAVAAAGTSVVHCPTSNLKLASGFSPVAKLLKAGINVALGSDSSASNNAIDLFAEMKLAAILAKAVAGEPSVVPASQALRMATCVAAPCTVLLTARVETGRLTPTPLPTFFLTGAPLYPRLNGARALGFGDITGSLEVGKAADFIAVDLGEIESLPCYSVISHLVYATGRNAVSDVWVDGTQLLAARTLTTIDENATKAELRAWAQKVREGKTAEDGHAAIPSKFRGPHGCGLTH